VVPGTLKDKLSDLRPHRCRVEYVCVVGLAWDFGQLRIRQDQREAAGNIGQPGRAGLADDEQNRDADRPEPLNVAAELIDRPGARDCMTWAGDRWRPPRDPAPGYLAAVRKAGRLPGACAQWPAS
jgi:hypothetical protein